MNKINEFKYLKDWCDEYYKTVGLKIHPSNVPVDVVLDDIMGHITMLTAHEKQFISWIDFTNARMKLMDEKIEKLEAEAIQSARDMLEATDLINKILAQKQDKAVKVKKND